MTAELIDWHDEADVLGVRVRAWFFDPATAAALADPVSQLLPLLADAPPQPLAPLGERRSHRVGALLAWPDAVLVHGDGLLCLSHKGGDGRLHERHAWQAGLRVDAMLSAIAHAMAVAGDRQRPTVALWRAANVVYQFAPSPPVLECLATNITAARLYWNEPQTVSPAQLASFCEARLRALPGLGRAPANSAPALSD
jgi:hypothetical protein